MKINVVGIIVFLEDNFGRVKRMRGLNSIRIYKVNYDILVKEVFELLKYVREEIVCIVDLGFLEILKCKFVLKKLLDIVYGKNWDLIIVDGLSSDGSEVLGWMVVIYILSVIVRVGNIITNVVVYDVDRMIERWFFWEFLCEENLVLFKGRYWNFGIKGDNLFNFIRFCF